MKTIKSIFLFIALFLTLCLIPVTYAESNYLASASSKNPEALNKNAMKITKTYLNVEKRDMAKFYPQDTLLFSYMNFDVNNIARIQKLFTDQVDQKVVEIQSLQKPKDFNDAFQIIKNLTVMFGPDTTLGILKGTEDQKYPPVLFITKIKNDKFSASAFEAFLDKKFTFNEEQYEGVTLIVGTSHKEILAFAVYNNYLIICNDLNSMKLAIDNYTKNLPDILSDDDATKALSYISDDSLIVLLTNNASISNYSYTKFLEEKKKKLEKPCEPVPPEDEVSEIEIEEDIVEETTAPDGEVNKQTEYIDEEVIINNDETDDNNYETSEEYEEEVYEENIPEERHYGKVSQFEKNKEISEKYLKEFWKTKSYTSIGLKLQPESFELESYTPYSLSFMDALNPALKKSIEEYMKPAKPTIITNTLPEQTAGFLTIANLGSISKMLYDLDIPDLKKSISAGKLGLAATTGLDVDKDLIPMLMGQTTAALVGWEEKPEPVVLLTYKPETLDTIKILLEASLKMDPATVIKEKTIKKNTFTVINSDKFPYTIAYGKFNDSIIFGKYEIIQKLAKSIKKPKKFLCSSKAFKSFEAVENEPNHLVLFLDINSLFELFGNSFTRDLPERVKKRLNSLILTTSIHDGNVYSLKLILK